MRVRWTVPAADDLENIRRYLVENFPHMAQSAVRRIYDGTRSLKTFPRRGRHGLKTGTRELLLLPLPYIVVYRITDDAVEILNIWHDAQERQ